MRNNNTLQAVAILSIINDSIACGYTSLQDYHDYQVKIMNPVFDAISIHSDDEEEAEIAMLHASFYSMIKIQINKLTR